MNTTEHAIGSVDSVAESLIESPEVEDVIEDTLEEVDATDTDDTDDGYDEAESEQDAIEDEDDGEDVGDEEEHDSHDESLFTVKVDGQEMQVSLDELTRGYSGQKYIQKSMQETAEARKAVESEYQALQQQSQQLTSLLQAAQSGQLNLTPPTPPSRELFDRDPIGFMDQKLQYEESMQQYNAQIQNVQQTMTQQQQLQQKQMQQHLQTEMQKLTSDPDFSDPKRAQEVKKDMLEFAETIGFTQDDIRNITDHRALIVLKNAAQYAKLQKSKPQAKEKAKGARPYVKSGVSKKPQSGKVKKARQAADRMKKTGSIDDVANFLIS